MKALTFINRTYLGKFLLGAVCGIGLIAIPVASVLAQTSSTFDFTIDSDNGDMDLNVDYDSAFPKGCTPQLRLVGSLYYEGDTTAKVAQTIGKASTSRKSRIRLKLNGLPAVSLNKDNQLPILTLQVRTTARCKRQRYNIVSNAQARYAVCGKASQELRPQRFLKELSEKFEAATD